MADGPTVDQAWNAVMNDVQAIKKGERNQAQGFNFRGVDTVVNAVGPLLRKHGVTVIPTPVDIQFYDYATSRGTAMRNATVKMHYTIRGPGGDTIDGGGAFGEASDAGDKSVSKAQSVAERVFLLQALMIPTDEPDPDSESHERASAPVPTQAQKALQLRGELLTGSQRSEIRAVWQSRGLPGKTAEMSDDEARLALNLLNEKFPAA